MSPVYVSLVRDHFRPGYISLHLSDLCDVASPTARLIKLYTDRCIECLKLRDN